MYSLGGKPASTILILLWAAGFTAVGLWLVLGSSSLGPDDVDASWPYAKERHPCAAAWDVALTDAAHGRTDDRLPPDFAEEAAGACQEAGRNRFWMGVLVGAPALLLGGAVTGLSLAARSRRRGD